MCGSAISGSMGRVSKRDRCYRYASSHPYASEVLDSSLRLGHVNVFGVVPSPVSQVGNTMIHNTS